MLGKTIKKLPPGFKYIPNFLTQPQKSQILRTISQNKWCTHLRRHQQYYGIKYFQTKLPDKHLQNSESMPEIDHFPLSQFQWLIQKIKAELKIVSFFQMGSPNQVLVNRYTRRDGLGYHVEDIQAFGEAIVGVSIGDADYLKLVPEGEKGQNKVGEIKVRLDDCSVYVLEGEARYHWKHGIGRELDGKPFKHQDFTRISLTFRDVIDTRRKL